MLDRQLVSQVAGALNIDESFVEKDWHVVRALGVIAGVAEQGVLPVFSGGTALAKGWNLIKRFSEDVDFKIGVTAATPSAARARRTAYRAKVLAALDAAGFTLAGKPLVGNQSRFARVEFNYGAAIEPAVGLRPTLKLELTFAAPARAPTALPLQSLLGLAAHAPPEIPAILCIDPLETAADKLCALAWRTQVRVRNAADDDPAIVRHLHDLAALASRVENDPEFAALVRTILQEDAKRAHVAALDGAKLLRRLLPTIAGDALWRVEYDRFVARMSYASEAEAIDFDQALVACARLVDRALAAE